MKIKIESSFLKRLSLKSFVFRRDDFFTHSNFKFFFLLLQISKISHSQQLIRDSEYLLFFCNCIFSQGKPVFTP